MPEMLQSNVDDILEKKYASESNWYDDWRDSSKYYTIITEITQRCIRENAVFFSQEKKALDAGCGTGRNIQTLLDLGAKKVNGLDLTEKLLEKATYKFRDNKCVELGIQNLNEKLDFPDEVFDVIICCKTLPHVVNIAGAMKEFNRTLKKDGTMILDFYSPFSFRRVLAAIYAQISEKKFFTRWDTIFAVKRYLGASNLKIVKVYGQRTFMIAESFVNYSGLHLIFKWLENRFSNVSILNFFSGYYSVVIKKY